MTSVAVPVRVLRSTSMDVEPFSVKGFQGEVRRDLLPSDLERQVHRLADPASARKTLHWGQSYLYALALETPAGPSWVFTTHLAYRMGDGGLRARQTREVDRFVRAHPTPGAAILTGDFNAPPDADEMRYLRGLTGLDGERTYYQDAFASCNPGIDGHTWCRENPYTRELH